MAYVAFNFIMSDGSPMIYFIESALWDDTFNVMKGMTSLEKFLHAFSMDRCDPSVTKTVELYEEGLRGMLPRIKNPSLFVQGYFLSSVTLPNNNEELWKRAFAVLKMPDVFDRAQIYEAYLTAATVIFNEVSLEHQREEAWSVN